MKKFIRYLYEYQNGKKVQNVGFVRVEEADDFSVIQIYGKGFPAAGNQSLEILLFYLMGNQCVGISMGKVKGVRPMFGYRLEYTAEDVGGMDIFKNIEGIILLNDTNGFQKWYGAGWNEKSVNIEQMIRREDVIRNNNTEKGETQVDEEQRRRPQENSAQINVGQENGVQKNKAQENRAQGNSLRRNETQENNTQEEAERENVPQRNGESEEIKREINSQRDSGMRDVLEGENNVQRNSMRESTRQENDVQRNNMREDKRQEDDVQRNEMAENTRKENDVRRNDMRVENVQEENKRKDESMEGKEGRTVIHKITRQDMARLPRREWKLANNSFLLHGCHNYHHLVSFEKDGKCWLGVPGIYDPREQRAASAFGFGQFMKPEEGEIELTEDEMNIHEDFGYWCRQVSNTI